MQPSQRVLYIALFAEVRLLRAPKLDQYKIPAQLEKDKDKELAEEKIEYAKYGALSAVAHGLANARCRLPWISIVVDWTVSALNERGDGDFSYYGELGLGEEDEVGETLRKVGAAFAQVKQALPATTDQVRHSPGAEFTRTANNL
jgi:hypothetical protein